MLDCIGVPALAFSLGMFIPLQLNTPLLVGGLLSWFIGSRSKDEKLNKARKDKGTLLASGLLAGGAIMGVVSAIMKLCGAEVGMPESYVGGSLFNVLAIVIFALLCIYLVWDSLRAKPAEA